MHVPVDLQMPIGIDGVSSLCFMPPTDKKILAVGTTGGRIRLYDSTLVIFLVLIVQRKPQKHYIRNVGTRV